MAKDPPPSRLLDRFIIRMPDGLRDQLAEEAKRNHRSTNAEIVDRLIRSFGRDGEKIHTDMLGKEAASRFKKITPDRAERAQLMREMAESFLKAAELVESGRAPKVEVVVSGGEEIGGAVEPMGSKGEE